MGRAVKENAEQRAPWHPFSEPANPAWFASAAAVIWENIASSSASRRRIWPLPKRSSVSPLTLDLVDWTHS
jgi:hypothetical protein